jgi:hypothetical protein
MELPLIVAAKQSISTPAAALDTMRLLITVAPAELSKNPTPESNTLLP